MRGAKQGRALEEQVQAVLRVMQQKGELVKAVYHSANSFEDRDGKDFTVAKYIDGKEISRSFGVTISLRRWSRGKMLHRDIPQLCFPLGTKPETMRRRILELFDRG